jgi:hypothetical protein
MIHVILEPLILIQYDRLKNTEEEGGVPISLAGKPNSTIPDTSKSVAAKVAAQQPCGCSALCFLCIANDEVAKDETIAYR